MQLRKQESARRVRKKEKKIILIVKQFLLKIRTELEMYSFPPMQKIMRLRYAPCLYPSVSPGHRSSLQVRINSYDDYTYYVRIPVYRVNGKEGLGLPEHPVTVLHAIHICMYTMVTGIPQVEQTPCPNPRYVIRKGSHLTPPRLAEFRIFYESDIYINLVYLRITLYHGNGRACSCKPKPNTNDRCTYVARFPVPELVLVRKEGRHQA